VRALLARYFERMRAIVERHGSTVEKFIGDGRCPRRGGRRRDRDDLDDPADPQTPRKIDYTRDDPIDGRELYDVILDIAGNRSLTKLRRALTSRGTLLIVGAEDAGNWLGVGRQLRAAALSPFVRQKLGTYISKEREQDLQELRTLLESGTITPVVDRTFPLDQVPDAIRYLRDGRAGGKIVITIRRTHAGVPRARGGPLGERREPREAVAPCKPKRLRTWLLAWASVRECHPTEPKIPARSGTVLVISGARPLCVRRLAPLDLVVVVAVVDNLALLVEAQHGHSRERELLPVLRPAGPPFDRGSVVVARRDWLCEPALDVLLCRELLTEITADTGQAQVGYPERGGSVHDGVGVQRHDGFGVSLGPSLRPCVSPASRGRGGIHVSHSTPDDDGLGQRAGMSLDLRLTSAP
jgi:hypothetical protein